MKKLFFILLTTFLADRVAPENLPSEQAAAKYLISEITAEVIMPTRIPFEQLLNQKFGRLTIIGESELRRKPSGQIVRLMLCRCDCGNKTIKVLGNLLNGHSQSCGCSHKESIVKHGLNQSRINNIYLGMKARCCNANNKAYKNYGGRGISICNEWLNDFMNFHNWAMANGYLDNLEIDRINNDGNYEPENCRWITRRENKRNQRRTKLTIEEAWDIRNAYALGCFTQKEIAVAYGVPDSKICNIINNKIWI